MLDNLIIIKNIKVVILILKFRNTKLGRGFQKIQNFKVKLQIKDSYRRDKWLAIRKHNQLSAQVFHLENLETIIQLNLNPSNFKLIQL